MALQAFLVLQTKPFGARSRRDNQGVTAQFNLNLLHRINRELDGDFDTDAFSHEAIYNDKLGRVEISLVSESEQSVKVADQIVPFDAGERILTEFSHKYTIEGFAQLADSAGLTLRRVWSDDDNFFGVLFLESE